jgi:diguanylate cyclase (GGDEF)-like protein/PAS domain S-box-containing protein
MTIRDEIGNNPGPDLFGLSLHMMCTLSLEGLICIANEALAEYLGYHPSQLNNRLLEDFIVREQGAQVFEHMKNLEDGQISEILIVDLNRADGSKAHCQLRMQRYGYKIFVSFAQTAKEKGHIEQPIDSYQLISKVLAQNTRDANRFYRYVLRELTELYGYGRGCLRIFEEGSEYYTQFQYQTDDMKVSGDWWSLSFDDSMDLWGYVSETQKPLLISNYQEFLKKRGLDAENRDRLENVLLIPVVQEDQVKACLLLTDREEALPEDRLTDLGSLVSAIWDISAQKLLSGRSEVKTTGLRQFYANMEEAIAIYEIIWDEAGEPVDYRFVDVNEAFFEQTGYAKQVVYGCKGSEFYGQSPAPYLQELAGVMRSRRPMKFEPYDKALGKYFHMSIMPLSKTRIATVFYDRSSQKNIQSAIQLEKERMAVALRSIGDGFISTDATGKIEDLNRVAESLTGWTKEQALGRPVQEVYRLVDEKTKERVEGPVSRVLQSFQEEKSGEHTRLVGQRGGEIFISDSASPIRNVAGKLSGVVLVFRDESKQKRHLKEVEQLSFHDSLTGLYNRTFFEKEIDRLNTRRQLPLSVIMGDVNGLKLTNDIYGHQKGDELLKNIADLLRKECRQEDILARWGGDEFVLLLPRTSKELAEEISERLIKSAEEKRFMDLGLSISIGASTKDEEYQNIYDVLAEAEQRMYRRKLLDKNSMRSSIITSLMESLSQKSHETKRHCARMESLSKDIGTQLCLTPSEINDLSLAARLHDVGMVIVPDEILQKTERLSEAEWGILKQHAEASYRICQSVPEVSHVARFVLAHQERLDGSGYPYGLQGEEIPLLSRIIAVADTYDALTHGRSYHAPKSSEEALAELKSLRGIRYDAQVVDVLCKLKAKEEMPVSPSDIFEEF